MLDSLKAALKEYQNRYRHPKLHPFECSDLYALTTEETPLAKWRWDEKWPNSDRAGVYLIFDKAGKLLYVGKSSVIGGRLSKYFQYEQPRTEVKMCKIVDDWGGETPMYVVAVAVPDSSTFEAAALEEFLIGRLHPCVNKMGLRE
jgi:hypothetical protein